MADEYVRTPYGSLSARLKHAALSELCLNDGGIQTGPFGSQLHQRDYVPVGTPIITVEHLGENQIIHRDLPRVSDEDRKRLARYALKEGDIVFSRVGSVDRRAYVSKSEDGWLFSGRCLRVRTKPEVIDARFLSYFFGLPSFKEYIRKIAVGATMPSLNTKLLGSVPLYFPPLPEQKSIASILGVLDNKIEQNRKMNETLEAMARAIFKSWFVDFDHIPSRGPNKEWQDSPLGKIPKGWRVRTIGDIIELAYGRALKEEIRQPGKIPVYGSNGQVGWHNEKLVEGPGVVVGRKGNPGIVTWVSTDFYPIDTTFYVVPKSIIKSMHYLFHALKLQGIASLGADSAVPGLNRNMAYMKKMLVPSSDIVSAFDKQVKPLADKVKHNNDQSLTLAMIRDALLPKLLSGELDLRDTGKCLEVNI